MTIHPPPIPSPEAMAYAEMAGQLIDPGSPTSPDTRAITAALLYIGAAIEAAAERAAVDGDDLAAMLDGQLDRITAAIDPAFVLPLPLWRRVLDRLRTGPAGPAGAGQDTPAGREVGDPDRSARDTKPGYRPPVVQEVTDETGARPRNWGERHDN